MSTKKYTPDAIRCDASHDLTETLTVKRYCRLCYNAYYRGWRAKNDVLMREMRRDSARKCRALRRGKPLTYAWLSSP